jgi:UDP-N-acetylbacillosamine N-acetyltransferase
MDNRILVWGSGGHALVVADALLSTGEDFFGFVDTVNVGRSEERLMDRPIFVTLEDAVRGCRGESMEIAIGFGHCAARDRLIDELDTQGVGLKTVIHKSAVVSNTALMGRGVYLGPNTVVEAKAVIGDGVIVNAASVICHESIIERAVAVCPNVVIGGKTKIGVMCWVGIGSTLIDKICIGKCSYIGAGSSVVNDLPEHVLAYGVPARVIREIISEF